MTETKNPPEYVDGWGELIKAHRLYVGLTVKDMADRLGMSEKSLLDIEVNRRSCPPGLLDSVREIVEEFDDEVLFATRNAVGLLLDNQDDDFITVKLGKDDWKKAIIRRAAVTGGRIMPILDGK